MTKLNKILTLGVVMVVVLAIALVFAVERRDAEIEKTLLEMKKNALIEAQEQPREITIYEEQPPKELKIQEVINMIPSRAIDDSEIVGWKSYTSEKLGISFKYPPKYFVVEAKETGTPTIGTSVYLAILEDTPYNRHRAKIKNPDFDYVIPEERKNADIEPGQGISFFKSVEGGFTQDVVQWYKEIKSGKNADYYVYAPADFIGMESVAYQAEGLFTSDGVISEREGYLYQFGVQYFNSPESPRDNFYKIISTITTNTAFKPDGTVSVNFCGNDMLADSVVLNGINIIKTMERIGLNSNKLNLCGNTDNISRNFFNETLGVAVKEWRWDDEGHYISEEEIGETNVYVVALYSKEDSRQSDDPFNQSIFIYKFDFNTNKVYTQYQFDGSFHEAGVIVMN